MSLYAVWSNIIATSFSSLEQLIELVLSPVLGFLSTQSRERNDLALREQSMKM